MLNVSIKLRYSLDKPPMERNEIVGNAFARTDRSALIKATRASDFPQNNLVIAFGDPASTKLLKQDTDGGIPPGTEHRCANKQQDDNITRRTAAVLRGLGVGSPEHRTPNDQDG